MNFYQLLNSIASKAKYLQDADAEASLIANNTRITVVIALMLFPRASALILTKKLKLKIVRVGHIIFECS